MPASRSIVAREPDQGLRQGTVVHGYYIQSGAFQDPLKARKWQAKLQKQGWKATIVDKNGGLHAVWLGPWPSRADADKAKIHLMRTLRIQGFIIKK